jgi:hypothetical protein
MKRLEKTQLKKLLGGTGGGGGEEEATCCTTVADCPDKEGKTKSCNSHYTCPSDNSKHKCMYVAIG